MTRPFMNRPLYSRASTSVIMPSGSNVVGREDTTGNLIVYNPSTNTWGTVGAIGGASGGGGGEVSASYVLTEATSSLPNGKIISAGTNITFGYEGNNLLINASIPTDVDAVYADPDAGYLVLAATSSLPNAKALIAGPGIAINQSQISASLLAGTNITLAQVGNAIAISASGGTMSAGPGITVNGNAVSASLTAGTGITLNTLGNNSIAISASASDTVGTGTAAVVYQGGMQYVPVAKAGVAFTTLASVSEYALTVQHTTSPDYRITIDTSLPEGTQWTFWDYTNNAQTLPHNFIASGGITFRTGGGAAASSYQQTSPVVTMKIIVASSVKYVLVA